ncbi:MAG: hypothetical protein BWX67_01199 [Thermotogae bacterium ADurb.Bin062]|nr:MAG: hypothetical protein BWX67_01199 [Thermotogota bacterium ADurb.Bin062]
MSSYGVYSRNKTRIDRAIVSPRSHRGVSAPSLCDGAIRLGTPTFKLACLKDKAGLTRRARRSQRRSVFSRVNTRFMFPLCSLRSLCETIFYFSKTCRTKVRRSQAHHRGVSGPSSHDGAIRLGTPTFKLACLKDKAGLTRRARRSQRRSVFSRVNTRFMFPLCSLRSLCETIFYFSKTCRTKVRRSQAHHRGVSASSFSNCAIRFYTCFEKQGHTEGTEGTEKRFL